jgi:hypothetical protein
MMEMEMIDMPRSDFGGIHRPGLPRAIVLSVLVAGLWAGAASGRAPLQMEFDAAPIHYSTAPVYDRVNALGQQLRDGSRELAYHPEQGYLPAVLEALGVSPSTQMLVFSKTSFQLRRISPETPRAVYFSDDIYVGWVPGGDVIEVTAVDPAQGAVFYTLSQDPAGEPQFLRDQGNCMACHASSRTKGVPGHLLRSVYAAPSGQPQFGAGTFDTSQDSPFEERWGGWYVTGTHGQMRHMGNVTSEERSPPYKLDVEAGANRKTLDGLVNLDRYLSPHSDLVALMVLEHQAGMHNCITLASYETRLAFHSDKEINEALGRPADHVSETTGRRINSVTEKLLRYLLFADEPELKDAVAGTSDFVDRFVVTGPFDKKGRSLRQFDLQQRLFRYPCSYLIYSDAFLALPQEVKQPVYRRLWEVLTGDDKSGKFNHLAAEQRQAIREILVDTHPDLPDYWH